jgi:hypothetical protein
LLRAPELRVQVALLGLESFDLDNEVPREVGMWSGDHPEVGLDPRQASSSRRVRPARRVEVLHRLLSAWFDHASSGIDGTLIIAGTRQHDGHVPYLTCTLVAEHVDEDVFGDPRELRGSALRDGQFGLDDARDPRFRGRRAPDDHPG